MVELSGEPEKPEASKIEVNGHWYYVVVCPQKGPEADRHERRQVVIVYHSPEDQGIPESLHALKSMYTEVVRDTAKDVELEPHISECLNEAICEVEEKQEIERDIIDRVEAVLEAHKEVHEGLDYQLEQESG